MRSADTVKVEGTAAAKADAIERKAEVTIMTISPAINRMIVINLEVASTVEMAETTNGEAKVVNIMVGAVVAVVTIKVVMTVTVVKVVAQVLAVAVVTIKVMMTVMVTKVVALVVMVATVKAVGIATVMKGVSMLLEALEVDTINRAAAMATKGSSTATEEVEAVEDIMTTKQSNTLAVTAMRQMETCTPQPCPTWARTNTTSRTRIWTSNIWSQLINKFMETTTTASHRVRTL